MHECVMKYHPTDGCLQETHFADEEMYRVV